MGDRLYTKTANLISFVAGERVSADKFNAMNSFYSRTFKEISRAIGSVYDAGFPNFSRVGQESYLTSKWNPHQEGNREGRPLDILNLARVIGPASNLNPRFLYRGAKEIEETIPQGVSSYTTVYPASALTGTLEGLAFAGGADLELASSYRFDSSTSTLFFSEETTQEYTLTYETDSLSYEGGPNYLYSEFNVIPDPNDTVAKLTITDQGSSTYLIELPIVTAQQAGLNNLADTEIITPDEPNNAVQLKLPYWMTNDSMMLPGEVIPENSVYLKNKTTGDTYLSATYKYQSATSLSIEGSELCIDEPNAHDFCLVVVGTDITTSIDDLRTKWFKHKHDGSFGEPRISVYDLSDRFKHLAPSGVYRASTLGWNYAPNYLHRDGYQAGADTTNGSNAMRGSIFMGSTTFNGLTDTSISGDNSYSIFFGDTNRFVSSVLGKLYLSNGVGDTEIYSSEKINQLAKNIDIAATSTNENDGVVNIFGSNKVEVTNGAASSSRLIVEDNTVLITNTVSEASILSSEEGAYLNSSMLLRKLKNADRVTPLITSVENALTPFIFSDFETTNIGYADKVKVQPLIADWEPDVEFSLPVDSNEFQDLGDDDYKSLNGSWISRHPYPYEGSDAIYGHAFLDNTNNEVTLFDGNPNSFYSVNLSKVLPDGTTISPLHNNEIITIRVERATNIQRYQRVLEDNSLESLETEFYFQVNSPGRDFDAQIVNNQTIHKVHIIFNYEGYVLNGKFYIEDPGPGSEEISINEVSVSFNGVKIAHTSYSLGSAGFVEGTIYKAKETYFNGKVWLEITG